MCEHLITIAFKKMKHFGLMILHFASITDRGGESSESGGQEACHILPHMRLFISG